MIHDSSAAIADPLLRQACSLRALIGNDQIRANTVSCSTGSPLQEAPGSISLVHPMIDHSPTYARSLGEGGLASLGSAEDTRGTTAARPPQASATEAGSGRGAPLVCLFTAFNTCLALV